MKGWPTHDHLRRMLEIEKTAVDLTTRGWKDTSVRAGQIEIASALWSDGVVLEGISLRLNCNRFAVDERLSVLLLTETPEKPRPFARIDWNDAEHANNHKLCGPFRFRGVGRTHFHDPRSHANIETPRTFLEAGLPIATELPNSPETFHALLEVCAKLLNVANLTETPTPPWQPRTPSML